MTLEQADIEGIAEDIYRRAKLDPSEPADPHRIAAKLLGDDAIQIVRGGPLRGDGYLARVGSQWRIYVKAKLSNERRLWVLSHELAEYALRDVVDERIEKLADAAAAAVLVPRRAVRRAFRVPEDIPRLSSSLCVSGTLAALRVGEAGGPPVAVVAPAHVHVRGPESWSWPSERELRGLAKAGAVGVDRLRLPDDPRRTVLIVAET